MGTGPWNPHLLYIVTLDFDPAVYPRHYRAILSTDGNTPFTLYLKHLYNWLLDTARVDMEQREGAEGYTAPPWQERPHKIYRSAGYPGDF